jgi:chromosomal replication initiation ATPase DnaA
LARLSGSWEKFLELIKSRVSINTYSTWFQPTRLNRLEGDTLYIQIPTALFRQVLTRTYGEIVKAVFHQMGTPQLKVQYVCTEEEPVQAAPAGNGSKQAKLDFGELFVSRYLKFSRVYGLPSPD